MLGTPQASFPLLFPNLGPENTTVVLLGVFLCYCFGAGRPLPLGLAVQ